MYALYLAQGLTGVAPPNTKLELILFFQLLLGTAHVEVGAAQYMAFLVLGEFFP